MKTNSSTLKSKPSTPLLSAKGALAKRSKKGVGFVITQNAALGNSSEASWDPTSVSHADSNKPNNKKLRNSKIKFADQTEKSVKSSKLKITDLPKELSESASSFSFASKKRLKNAPLTLPGKGFKVSTNSVTDTSANMVKTKGKNTKNLPLKVLKKKEKILLTKSDLLTNTENIMKKNISTLPITANSPVSLPVKAGKKKGKKTVKQLGVSSNSDSTEKLKQTSVLLKNSLELSPDVGVTRTVDKDTLTSHKKQLKKKASSSLGLINQKKQISQLSLSSEKNAFSLRESTTKQSVTSNEELSNKQTHGKSKQNIVSPSDMSKNVNVVENTLSYESNMQNGGVSNSKKKMKKAKLAKAAHTKEATTKHPLGIKSPEMSLTKDPEVVSNPLGKQPKNIIKTVHLAPSDDLLLKGKSASAPVSCRSNGVSANHKSKRVEGLLMKGPEQKKRKLAAQEFSGNTVDASSSVTKGKVLQPMKKVSAKIPQTQKSIKKKELSKEGGVAAIPYSSPQKRKRKISDELVVNDLASIVSTSATIPPKKSKSKGNKVKPNKTQMSSKLLLSRENLESSKIDVVTSNASSPTASPALGKKKRKQLNTLSSGNTKLSSNQVVHRDHTEITQKSSKKLSTDLLPEVLEKVTAATLKLIKDGQSSTNELFAECVPITLHFVVFKVPNTRFRQIRCVLPHSSLPSEPDICLIVPDMDRGRKTDEELNRVTEAYTELLKEQGVTKIGEVIPFSKLRAEYAPFEMKRRLVKSFDLFLCDGRIQGHVVHFLGKIFEKAKKIPTPIHAIEQTGLENTAFVSNLNEKVEQALHRVYFTLHNHGASYAVKVGHSLLSESQLSENVVAVWKTLNESFPGGVTNIRTVYLKGPTTVGIPLYASLVPVKHVPSAQSRKKKPVTGDLSTQLGKKVMVFPSGRIKVLSNPTEEDIAFSKQVDEIAEDQKKIRKRNKKGNVKTDDDDDLQKEVADENGVSDEDEDVDDAENAYLSGLQQ